MADPTTSTHSSQACCSTPIPSASSTYNPKGTNVTLAETTCYVTGSASASKAIMYIYDVFGFRNPTLQGADILASQGYLVVMPNLFDDEPAEPEWMTLPEDQRNAKLGGWMAKIADPKPHIERIHAVMDAVQAQHASVQEWGAIGFCWGGKIVALTSGEGTRWKAGIQSSPARVDAGDAAKVNIPMMMLASKDEPKDLVEAFDKALTVPKVVETFETQIHGWMSARADLQDQEAKKEYERGYKMSLDWFNKYV